MFLDDVLRCSPLCDGVFVISPLCSFQRGSVRVDTVDDFAYGSKILVNTPDQVRRPL